MNSWPPTRTGSASPPGFRGTFWEPPPYLPCKKGLGGPHDERSHTEAGADRGGVLHAGSGNDDWGGIGDGGGRGKVFARERAGSGEKRERERQRADFDGREDSAGHPQ